jgi:hypothetical protein
MGLKKIVWASEIFFPEFQETAFFGKTSGG